MAVLPTLSKRRSPLASGEAQRRILARLPLARSFEAALEGAGLRPLRPTGIGVLQVNVGKKCNQTCGHCHVDAGPDRTEMMAEATVDACLRVLRDHDIPVLDITGGAPELHPSFRRLVREARALGRHVIDRCNLSRCRTCLTCLTCLTEQPRDGVPVSTQQHRHDGDQHDSQAAAANRHSRR